ncbi:MAG: DUF302 domain-containing protein [Prolixibacteraceae bacterium]|nr:DUF302 domain-containing protein [Prolixibacteraceae bacterium]MBN2772741.1 DUF302 domain-containing protein [Prolixibacteraceae bacterium]
MKNRFAMFLTGLISGVIITVVMIVLVLPGKMFLVNESKLNFKETTEKIIEQAAEYKWSMPHQYDLQATMKKNGFEVLPVTVFSLCQPQFANKILSGSEERLVSAIMPCRVAVYEAKDGKTYISRLNAGMFSKLMGKKIRNIMGEVAVENEQILEPIIKK